jgi:1-phosphatidylinositol phosphodiesterase
MLLLLILSLFLLPSVAQYNHQSSTLLNPDWMSKLDNGIPLRKLSLLGSHSSMSTGVWGDAFQTQASSLTSQLMMGMRAIDIRCRHFNNGFSIHDRLVYLNIELDGVLSIVQAFLALYPM